MAETKINQNQLDLDQIADSNLSNLSSTGKQEIAHQAALSNTITKLTAPAMTVETEYTAPTDGQFFVNLTPTSTNSGIYMYIKKTISDDVLTAPIKEYTLASGDVKTASLNVKAGDKVTIGVWGGSFTAHTGDGVYFRYCVGNESLQGA